ncbi:MAG: hypothetical protein D3923_01405 [Candidatus Electrothrix sp. AR3]|nr:hypothetical protein [Candidatus Electrothrix sp. AR3]
MYFMRSLIPVFLFVVSLFVIPLSGNYAAANSFDDAQTLILKSDAVFRSFMSDSDMTWFHENVRDAYGIFIVPQMLRGGVIIAGSGGSGVLLTRDRDTGSWSYPAFYSMGSVSLGLQIGADASELVLMIMTEQGLNSMLSTEFKIGADISVAAGPVGKNAKTQTVDVLAFGRSKGVFGGISLEGAVITPSDQLNHAYYGKIIDPLEILVRRSVSNPQAEPLRNAMPYSGVYQQQYPHQQYQKQPMVQPGYPSNYQEPYPQAQHPQQQEYRKLGYY